MLCIVTDFTKQKQAEQQLHGLREQLERAQRFAITGQLSLELAHEIGNPITLMSSKIQSLIREDTVPSDELLKLLGHIDRIKGLLMRFSDSGQNQPLCISDESIDRVVQDVLDLVPAHDENNRLTVSIEVQEGLPQLKIDKAQITQILLNLLKNAMEACDTNGHIRLAAEQKHLEDKNADYIIVSVEDDGCGIANEQLSKIFESFYSTKSTDKTRGLGLPICQSIALKHNGWMEAKSEQGKGSIFSLFLPLTNTKKEKEHIITV